MASRNRAAIRLALAKCFTKADSGGYKISEESLTLLSGELRLASGRFRYLWMPGKDVFALNLREGDSRPGTVQIAGQMSAFPACGALLKRILKKLHV